MGDFDLAKQKRENHLVDVPPNLRSQLLAEFEKKYKKPGSTRARMGEFLAYWSNQLEAAPPSDQSVWNLLRGHKQCKHQLCDGLCRLLLGCPYEDWDGSAISTPVISSLVHPIACPYQGLSAFQEEDAEYFFGREAFTDQLIQAVQNKPFVAVVGASGSGKSSVVLAGLIPRLRKAEDWLIASLRPSNDPFYRIAETLVPLLESEESKTKQLILIREQAEAFKAQTLRLQDVVDRVLQEHPKKTHFLLIIDQFEELYTLCQLETERALFLSELTQSIKVREQQSVFSFTLVITLRADFYGQAIESFSDLLEGAVKNLRGMKHAELQDVIEKPAQKAGIGLEDGLTERFLQAVGKEPGNLPLLEFALTSLWEHQNNGKLTHAAYTTIGGVETALAQYADQKLDEFNSEEQQQAQRIFTRLVCPGEGTGDTRRLATRVEIGDECWNLVRKLAAVRLVVTNQDESTGIETVEIVHEALIKRWQRLQQWMDCDREFLNWRKKLNLAIRQWEDIDRQESALLRGVLLAKAKDWNNQRLNELQNEEKEFIQISQRYQEEELRQEKLAELKFLKLHSQAIFPTDQLGALIAGVKAGQLLKKIDAPLDVRVKTICNLQRLLFEIKEKNRLCAHNNPVTAVSFHPNGEILVSGDSTGTIIFWDLYGKQLVTVSAHSESICRICCSLDGQFVASASWDTTIKIWNLSGELIKVFEGHQDGVESVTFSPNSEHIASSSSDGTVKIWSIQGELLRTIEFKESPSKKVRILDVCFSPDGQMLAISGDCGLWLLKSFNDVKPLIFQEYGIFFCVAFSPDGKTLAASENPRMVHTWNLDGELLSTCHVDKDSYSLAFNPRSHLLAAADDKGSIKISDSYSQEIETLYGHKSTVWSICFSPNGELLASAGNDGVVRVWSLKGVDIEIYDVEDERPNLDCSDYSKVLDIHSLLEQNIDLKFDWENFVFQIGNDLFEIGEQYLVEELGKLREKNPQILRGHQNRITSVSISPNNQILVSSDRDGLIKIWNFSSGQELHTLRGHTDSVEGVNFSPDGQMIVSASFDRTVKLWSTGGVELASLIYDDFDDGVSNAVFNSDGKKLFVLTNSQMIIVFDFDLDSLLSQACSWLSSYLKYNFSLNSQDKCLCDGIEVSLIEAT